MTGCVIAAVVFWIWGVEQAGDKVFVVYSMMVIMALLVVYAMVIDWFKRNVYSTSILDPTEKNEHDLSTVTVTKISQQDNNDPLLRPIHMTLRVDPAQYKSQEQRPLVSDL